MATIYTLLCWGGKDGKSVTVNTTTDLVTLANHGTRTTGTALQFISGSLPTVSGTALALDTTYYAKYIDYSTFELYYDSGLSSKINFTSTGSSLVMRGALYAAHNLSGALARYTISGTVHAYHGISGANTYWSGAGVSSSDDHVWEIDEDFYEEITSGITLSLAPQSLLITTMVNGTRSPRAWHGGVYGAGFGLRGRSGSTMTTLTSSMYRLAVDGFTITHDSFGAGSPNGIALHNGNVCDNMIFQGRGKSTSGIGINMASTSTLCVVRNNLVLDWGTGIRGTQFIKGMYVANNTVSNCTTGMGFSATSSNGGFYYNNVSLGNTTNWQATTGTLEGASNNAGLTGEAWIVGSGTRVETTTAAFNSYNATSSAADFTPAAGGALVDAGIVYYDPIAYDLAGGERPNYNNGGSEAYDIGCYEYDAGYGPHPITWDLEWDISGSTVRIFDTGTQTLVDSTTSGTTLSASGVAGGSVYDVTVTKPGYLNVRLTGITASDGLTTTITQEVDFAYLASSGLTYETNADINTGAKEFSLTAASSVQNWYSFWIETWHTDPDFYNTDFPLQANGPYSIKLLSDYTMDGSTSIGYLNTGGIAYVDSSSVTTDFWMCLQTSGVPTGMTVKWEFSDGGTVQSAASTGDINQLVSIYAGSGSTDYTGYCILKVQGEDGSSNLYNQVETDLVSQFGTLSDTLYVLGMTPTDTGVDYSAPGGTPTITDHGASPVTWHGKSFSITIQSDLSGDNILRYLRHNATLTISAGSDDQFNWHDFIKPNGSGYKSVRGYVYGDTGATLKGVKVVTSGGDDHPDFNLFTADDGSTYTPAVSASISITGMPTATGASTRLQIINYTASQASAWQATTAYAQGDVVLRTTGVGTESTAGLYMRATTGGTSGGTEPTWDTTVGNTTADGTVTWTTYAVLYYDADPVTSSYSSTYVDGEEILAGETVKIRFAEMDAGTSFKTYSTSLVAASSGFSAAVDTTADSVYATWGLDGSSYDSTYSPDYVANYLILDTNTDFSGKSAGAYFCYLLTTSQGMYLFWGGMTLIDSGNIRINDSVLDMYFDESGGFVKQTDSVRIFRDDGTRPAIDPTTGGSGIEINWRVPVNVVSTGGSALTPTESAYLLSLPSATDVWTNGTRTLTSGGGGASVDDIYSDPRSLTLPKFIALK